VTDIYLVECKWRNDAANIDDIDSLRSRLRRADTRAIGILLSYNGFTTSVLAEVLANRSQPVLLLSGGELEKVTSGWYSLSDLIWRKRQALLVDGEVLLDGAPRRKGQRLVRLPQAETEVLLPGGGRTEMLDCVGVFGQFVFAHDLPDIDWVPASGLGVTLDIQPPVHDAPGLVSLLKTMANLGWSTPNARWSIQQSRRNWHGWGPQEFTAVVGKWRERAKTEAAHHSEEFFYVDVCDGGFYTIAATIMAHHQRELRNFNISFQLQGIPLDTRPLLELCHTLGVHEHLYLRPRDTQSIKRIHLHDKNIPIGLPRALVVNAEPAPETMGPDDWVVGLVIENPFIAGHPYLAEDDARELHVLDESELLVCTLAEHHRLDQEEKYGYYLVRLDYARTSDGLVCQAVANWRRAGS
jgi:hypothetical protein